MEKSDDYIDFRAYIRYLRKVTGDPADPEALKKAILDKTVENSEMQTVYKGNSKPKRRANHLLFQDPLQHYNQFERIYQ